MSLDVERDAFPESDPDEVSSNSSGNGVFRDVLAARVSRRDVVRGGSVVDPDGRPRAATVVVRRHDGGVIGT